MMTRRVTLTALLAALVVAGGAALVASKVAPKTAATAPTGTPAFTATKWPFPMDQWGLGNAWRCSPEDCGTDAELERVGDVELFGQKFSAPADGHAIAVAWM